MVKKLFQDLFLKNQNQNLWINKVLFSLFLLYVKFKAIKTYWNGAADHLLLRLVKYFPASFFELFLKENISFVIF